MIDIVAIRITYLNYIIVSCLWDFVLFIMVYIIFLLFIIYFIIIILLIIIFYYLFDFNILYNSFVIRGARFVEEHDFLNIFFIATRQDYR